ncbi:cupin domain-containing protein [uncultured Ruegeria sp.]|uniref:cupin domain-containing protein n=1 Tax=uncultured Ruegeria sp. TaxID=259304 RepID=UPI00262B3939|nr:cupin domain-containing protein [uncultured Ruegeria sp.]
MSHFPIVSTGEHVTRQVLSDHSEIMVVAFRFQAAGAIGDLHSHPHVQATYVESGRFRFTLGEREQVFGPGDSFVIPSGQTHGCICLEPGKLVDSFTPRRDDFL